MGLHPPVLLRRQLRSHHSHLQPLHLLRKRVPRHSTAVRVHAEDTAGLRNSLPRTTEHFSMDADRASWCWQDRNMQRARADDGAAVLALLLHIHLVCLFSPALSERIRLQRVLVPAGRGAVAGPGLALCDSPADTGDTVCLHKRPTAPALPIRRTDY